MKKVVLLFIFFLFCLPTTSEASTMKLVNITETTPVFNQTEKVAVFLQGSAHTVVKENDRYYFTYIGGEEVKFSKKRAQLVNQPSRNWKGAHPVRATTNEKVIILDRPSQKGQQIGYIRPKQTIQLQRLQGTYFPINIGGTTGYIHQKQVTVERGIPVFMYHELVIQQTQSNPSQITVKQFQEQMDYLQNNGWTTITPVQLEQWLQQKMPLPKKSVLITFDDGYASTAKWAYPILKKREQKATVFLITSRLNQPNMLTAEHLTTTADVFSYQSHTHAFHLFNTYTNLSALQWASKEEIMSDLQQSKQLIQTLSPTSQQVIAHAYPYGKWSPTAIEALQETGFSMAFTIEEGHVFSTDHPYLLKRQRVHPNMTLDDFVQKLHGR